PNQMFDYYQGGGLAPARRAGAMMYLVGGIVLAAALCCAGMGAMFPRIVAQQPEIMNKLGEIPEATPQRIQLALVAIGIVMLIVAILHLVLAPFVRRGSKGAIITGIVMTILLILAMGLQLLGSALQLASAKAEAGVSACVLLLVIALLVLQLVWLISAMRGADHALASQYAMQYWQYAQQQQQAY